MKKVILALVLGACVVVVLGLLLIFEGDGVTQETDDVLVQSNENKQQNVEQPSVEEEPSVTDERSTTSDGVEKELIGFEVVDPVVAPHSEESCESNLEAEVATREAEYYQGRIIVSFKDGVTRTEALTLIEAKGYRPDENQAKQYDANYFFTTYVDDETEIVAVCDLQDEQEVRNAVLDYKLDLVL